MMLPKKDAVYVMGPQILAVKLLTISNSEWVNVCSGEYSVYDSAAGKATDDSDMYELSLQGF